MAFKKADVRRRTSAQTLVCTRHDSSIIEMLSHGSEAVDWKAPTWAQHEAQQPLLLPKHSTVTPTTLCVPEDPLLSVHWFVWSAVCSYSVSDCQSFWNDFHFLLYTCSSNYKSLSLRAWSLRGTITFGIGQNWNTSVLQKKKVHSSQFILSKQKSI